MYPPHLKLQFGGYLGAGDQGPEIWSCSIPIMAFSGPERTPDQIIVPTFQQQQDVVDNMANIVTDFFVRNDNGIMGNAFLDWVKFNAIGPDGKYVHDQTSEVQIVPGQPGGSGNVGYLPFQVARVISFRTSANRGLASKGRIYLPSPKATINASGLDTGVVGIPAAVGALLKALKTDNGLVYYMPAVVSGVTRGGEEHYRFITEVWVGNVLDTQRRRRNALPETYTKDPVVYPA